MTTPGPFLTLGKLTVDVVKPFFGTLPALQSADFQAPATALSVATVGPTPSGGWYTATGGKAFLVDINKLGRTQFRLRFTLPSNNDSVGNYAVFFSGDALTTGNRPELIVQYYVR